MSFAADPREWAEAVFGTCALGDVRRTDRLVDYAARQALNPAGSTSEVRRGDDATAEGAYRLLENEAVQAVAIEDAVFDHVAHEGAGRELLLDIQDTTRLAGAGRTRHRLAPLPRGPHVEKCDQETELSPGDLLAVRERMIGTP